MCHRLSCFWILLLLAATLCANAEEVVIKNGQESLYGTLQLPEGKIDSPVPAILLLSGSGPTDRDGNSPLLPGKIDSQKHIAEFLSQRGVATLRYDKVFSGKTGLAGHQPDQVGLDTYVSGATAAYKYLAARPEVDPRSMVILGHSEGGLIALIMAKEQGLTGLKGLILAMPLSEPYLTTMFDQISAQLLAAAQAGSMTSVEAQTQIGYLRSVLDEVAKDGTSPTRAKLLNPLQALFTPVTDHFFHTCAAYDPAELAESIDLPVLVLAGQRDVQITAPMIDHLMTGFADNPDAELVTLPATNHVFKVVPSKAAGIGSYTEPAYPFSPLAESAISDWVKANL